jgi:5-hydroxyisourate hydrolase
MITTHVLDTSRGKPGAAIEVRLERFSGEWREIARGATDPDGRWKPGVALEAAAHRLTFNVRGISDFFTEVQVQFEVRDAAQHYHVPLLVSPFGYTTYRGS